MSQAGFRERPGLSYLEKRRIGPRHPDTAAAALGAEWPAPELWDRIGGMEHEKALIETRVILPHSEPELALLHGVKPPTSIILFGPPGTGKTTFARAIAARLGWPFVELYPNQLEGDDAASRARSLAAVFHELTILESAVIFIDEVEDLAQHRDRRPDSHAITNELLTLIPGLRSLSRRLLVCATNSVRTLDRAFTRPGRFDYLIPIGPPDSPARRQVWSRYAREITDGDIDLDRLADESDRFSPADIEFAAQKAAHVAFERSHRTGAHLPATTDDFLAAMASTRPSLTPAMLDAFVEDIEVYARS
jgi:SpoVK/Ycf46/Vps4 family AAA+-type ATPase